MLYNFHNPEIHNIRYLVVKFETILRFKTFTFCNIFVMLQVFKI